MDEGKKSLFNAGVAQTERIDALQRAINSSRFNPLAKDLLIGKYNYEIMVSACDGLLAEVWAKLDKKEKIEGQRIKNVITNFLRIRPVLNITTKETKVHKKNYEDFLELFQIYENTVKIYLDSHNLNAPNIEDDEGL